MEMTVAGVTLGSKAQLTAAAARAIAEAAAAEAERQNLRMSIAVVDDGGYLLYFMRMSESVAAASAEVAVAKARSAALFKRATLSWEEAAKDRAVIMKIPNVVPLGGGVPLMAGGVGIGAIGVSGASSTKDDEIAQAGAKLIA
jgi:glc operon protein GlcG